MGKVLESPAMNAPASALPQTDDPTRQFARLRARLQGIAYRMLGSVAEAEELVQDVWLRWHDAQADPPDNGEAWLVTVTTRLSIDRLRAAKVQREHYSGMWLPEPLLTHPLTDPLVGHAPDSPETLLERAGEVSVAFLRLLERLSPEARAAFLLREVLDMDYPEVARMVDKSEAACRQLVSRAKKQLADERPRYDVPAETHHRLLSGFAQAMAAGDFGGLSALLADGAELIGDGGGKVLAFPKPLQGGRRIAQLFFAAHRKLHDRQRLQLVHLNGEWGLLRLIDGVLESALTFETDGERILSLHVQRNPDKLARIAAAVTTAVTNEAGGASCEHGAVSIHPQE
jgi:RNA polymerase sigma-70 factor (TIGR02957 family)